MNNDLKNITIQSRDVLTDTMVKDSVTPLERTREYSKTRFLEIISIASRILLMTIVIFIAFFVPFFIGMETSQMKNRASSLQVEIQSINTKIQEYNQKIAAFGEMLLLNNKIQKSEME